MGKTFEGEVYFDDFDDFEDFSDDEDYVQPQQEVSRLTNKAGIQEYKEVVQVYQKQLTS